MRRGARALGAVTGGICVIGLSVQILLGLTWMVCNFAGFQKFGDSYLYLKSSGTFLCDEYTGILYPALMLLARGIEGILRLPGRSILYLLQLSAAFFAARFFLSSVCPVRGFWREWGSLAILTYPMAMQCHLAVLPDSLAGSVFLLELAGLWRLAENGGRTDAAGLAKTAACWLVMALLKPEYLYLGAVPVILMFLYGMLRRNGRASGQVFRNLVIVAAVGGIIVAMNDLTQVEGAYGRVRLSLNAAMFSRMSWSTFQGTYGMWPEEMRECVDEGMARESSLYPDNMLGIAGEALEQGLGPERAKEMFGVAAEFSRTYYGERIRHEILWDVLGYGFAPVISELMLNNRGYDSYCTRNYEIMRGRTPLLTKYYYHYGCWWFGPGLVLAGLLWLGSCLPGFLRARRGAWDKGAVLGRGFCLAGIFLSCGALAGWYAMRGGGVFDYKQTIVIGCLFTAWTVWGSLRGMAGIGGENGAGSGSVD